ncbi:class I SAM-dependent methyltransferase [Pseudomonas alcaligenes]|uniref:class I SAM-dependent methyltransferase n=1 Tax=Aquipseudomonas alcaligenes TaxID=43263 RepID=UPI002E7ABB77|nr:class I SAM-dependent methyltransferase [Pseudomonas alcaligenes]MEE1950839.1 class I SAM-dependent methyltransferase [Pseudomonas alcaligenes]
MKAPTREIHDEVAGYYSRKLAEHGETPQGVDWNGEAGQILRFQQLCRVVDVQSDFSLNDLGCGYGALYEFLSEQYQSFSYHGVDVSADMIAAAKARYHDAGTVDFLCASEPGGVADYCVASGIFNVRLGRTEQEWLDYIESTLCVLDGFARKGFAFNCLTSYSDADRMREDLYYANPGYLFDLCKRRFSRHVALLHDYGMYEFTMVVRK